MSFSAIAVVVLFLFALVAYVIHRLIRKVIWLGLCLVALALAAYKTMHIFPHAGHPARAARR
jgi:hypothetical protein